MSYSFTLYLTMIKSSIEEINTGEIDFFSLLFLMSFFACKIQVNEPLRIISDLKCVCL